MTERQIAAVILTIIVWLICGIPNAIKFENGCKRRNGTWTVGERRIARLILVSGLVSLMAFLFDEAIEVFTKMIGWFFDERVIK